MTAYPELKQIFEKIHNLKHLEAIAHWDEAVMMPTGGGEARAHAMATLSTILHNMLTDSKIPTLIHAAKEEPLKNSWDQANLRLIEKKYLHASCVPSDLIEEFTKATVTSEQAWRKLRAENNWKDFIPFLKKTLDCSKKIADIHAKVANKSSYDVLLDDFSPGLSRTLLDPLFTKLKQTLPKLIKQVQSKQIQTPKTPLGPFPIEQQRQLAVALMNTIGFDFNRGRLDVSHHPFCGGVPQDVRITSRYNPEEFITSAMAVCHETGHAKYEQNLPEEWLTQPVGQALGMAIHESQSLLIEMQVCRSQEFMDFLSPLVKNHLGDHPDLAAENLYALYTEVKPLLIRVDSDELTYPLHVILRYEIEKELIDGTLKVEDLPQVWNEKMTEYLGLSTENNYKDGVMQDVHWPAGLFGYFPAYTIGALVAAQLFATAKKIHPQLLQQIQQGNFSLLFQWLKENVHSKASSVDFDQLLIAATGETLNPDFFIQHLKKRYL
jgi:carboxypeptidase Taq